MIIRCATAAAITGGGPAQTIASGSGPGSTLQPKAAVYELTTSATLDTVPAQRRHGIGMTEGTNQRAVGVMAEDGNIGLQADAGTRTNNAAVIDLPLNSSELVDGVAAWNSWQSGGSEITWSDFLVAALQIKATHFFGDDIECAVVEFTHDGAQDSAQSVTGLPFAPNFAHQISSGLVTPFSSSAGVAHMSYGLGYAVRTIDGAIQQWCIADMVVDRAATTSGGTIIRDDSIAQAGIFIGAVPTLGARLETTAWTSDGATFTKRNSGDPITIALLFIRFHGNRKLWAGVKEFSVSAGNVSVTDPGFRPEAYFAGATCLADPNTLFNTAAADTGRLSHGVYTGQESVYCSGASEDGATTSDTASSTGDDFVFRCVTPGGATRLSGAHVSIDALGFTLDLQGTLLGDGAPNVGFVAIGPIEVDVGWIPATRRWRRQIGRM